MISDSQARDRALHAEQQLRVRDKELGKLGKVLDHSKAAEHETSAQRMVSEEERGRLDGEAAQVRSHMCGWGGVDSASQAVFGVLVEHKRAGGGGGGAGINRSVQSSPKKFGGEAGPQG